jgi:topoisomerase-4 subunit A
LVDAELEIGIDHLEDSHFEVVEVHTDPSKEGMESEDGAEETVNEIRVAEVSPEPNEDSPTFEPKEEEEEEPKEAPKKAKPSFKSAAKPLVVEEPAKEVKPKTESEKPAAEGAEPPVQKKKISFEITNPGDIKIDDKGQGSLF